MARDSLREAASRAAFSAPAMAGGVAIRHLTPPCFSPFPPVQTASERSGALRVRERFRCEQLGPAPGVGLSRDLTGNRSEPPVPLPSCDACAVQSKSQHKLLPFSTGHPPTLMEQQY